MKIQVETSGLLSRFFSFSKIMSKIFENIEFETKTEFWGFVDDIKQLFREYLEEDQYHLLDDIEKEIERAIEQNKIEVLNE